MYNRKKELPKHTKRSNDNELMYIKIKTLSKIESVLSMSILELLLVTGVSLNPFFITRPHFILCIYFFYSFFFTFKHRLGV